MNTGSTFLVRLLCALLVCAWAMDGTAQGKDGKLAKDFDKLSAKERSQIAAKETQEAAEDSGYQALMRQADHDFQATRYEDALASYEKARVMRPYNVYPKVKIQDLQALIKKRDQEKAAAQPLPTPEPMPEPQVTEVPAVVQPPSPSPNPAPVLTPAPPSPAVPELAPKPVPPAPKAPATVPPPSPVIASQVKVDEPIGTPPTTAKPAVRSTPANESRPVTTGERVYVEAGAVVTERTVDDDGRAVIYRKVVHAWGQTFYFKEGLAISQFQWDQRFSE